MVPRHIFREYDIRGLHETELTDEVAEVRRPGLRHPDPRAVRAIRTASARRGPRVALGRTCGPAASGWRAPSRRGMTRRAAWRSNASASCRRRRSTTPWPASRRRRHPGHRQPQSSRVQWLQDDASRSCRCSARRSRACASGSSAATLRRRVAGRGGRPADPRRLPRDADRAAEEPERAARGDGLRQRLRRHGRPAGVRADGPHRHAAVRRARRALPESSARPDRAGAARPR